MPGANCSIVGCSINRRNKNIGIFKLPKARNEGYKRWRNSWLDVITRTRVIDESFKAQIKNDTVHVCEKHFKQEDIDICEYIVLYSQ